LTEANPRFFSRPFEGIIIPEHEDEESAMRLSVNVDHFATLRQARRSDEPEPVLAALLAEQAGAEGITAHIRSDRRHINERDLRLLRAAIKTKLTVEMAATEELKAVVLDLKPDTVCLVPEKPEELTTTGGLDVRANRKALGPYIKALAQAGIRVCIFVDPAPAQIQAVSALGVPQIELHSGIYGAAKSGPDKERALDGLRKAAALGARVGLEVTAGHDLGYHNVGPIAAIPQISELSIGFSIVARASIVGISQAVWEMAALLK
jgi:pyridoxine 5-phosphate synthase